MLYQRQTTGSVKEVAGRLEKAVKDNHGVLRTIDLRAKMAEKDGRITIAAIKPTLLIGMYEGGLSLQAVAEEIERTIIRIIDAVVV